MILAGVQMPQSAIHELATMIRFAGADGLALRLERAIKDEVEIVELTIPERILIVDALDDPPEDLAELRAVLMNEYQWRASEGLG